MVDWKYKYLKNKLKYINQKGGSGPVPAEKTVPFIINEIEIKIFGEIKKGHGIKRLGDIEKFLQINLDEQFTGFKQRVNNINSTINFASINYVSPHIPNKGIALFILGNEPGHESSAFGTCYMLKSRLNIHMCEYLYTNNQTQNIQSVNVKNSLLKFDNKSLLLQLEQKLKLYLILDYTHLYLFIECHGSNEGLYCNTFHVNDLIYIWNKYYDKYFFAMLFSDTCNSHILIKSAEEQNLKNIIGFTTDNCNNSSQLRIVKSITFSALNFANINNLNALLFVEYLKNITKKWIQTNLYENDFFYNIKVNHTTIDDKNVSLVVNYDSYNSINNIVADFYPLNSSYTNFLDENNNPFNAGWKSLIFWFLTTPYNDLRSEEIVYLKKFIKNKFEKGDPINIEYFIRLGLSLLDTVKKLKNKQHLDLIKKLYNNNYKGNIKVP